MDTDSTGHRVDRATQGAFRVDIVFNSVVIRVKTRRTFASIRVFFPAVVDASQQSDYELLGGSSFRAAAFAGRPPCSMPAPVTVVSTTTSGAILLAAYLWMSSCYVVLAVRVFVNSTNK